VTSHFYRWNASGVWQQVLKVLRAQSDAVGQFDWKLHMVDGSVIRAHQHAASAKGGTLKPKRSGAAGADFPPSATCVRRDEAGPLPSC